MKKKIQIPPIFEFERSKDFFKAFMAVNKSVSKKYSHRFFAQKLKWPVGYISDVEKGRKPFTLKRAFEFAEFYKLSALEKERLIWFSLAENGDEDAQAYFRRKLFRSLKDVLNPTVITGNLLEYNNGMQMLTLLKWSRKKMSPQEIKLNFDIPSLTIEDIEKAIQFIEKNALLKWDQNGKILEASTANFSFDNSEKNDGKPYVGIEVQRKFAENFIHFLDHPKSPSTYNSGFIEIKKSQFMPVALQMMELRNWIFELSRRNQEEPNPVEESYPMQINLDLFPVSKPKSSRN